MKTKHLLIILGILIVVLLYFLGCMIYLNHGVLIRTKKDIESYVFDNCLNCKWEYKGASYQNKDTFKIKIKIKNDEKTSYHHLIFDYYYRFIESI